VAVRDTVLFADAAGRAERYGEQGRVGREDPVPPGPRILVRYRTRGYAMKGNRIRLAANRPI
jgi:hypothetical protein